MSIHSETGLCDEVNLLVDTFVKCFPAGSLDLVLLFGSRVHGELSLKSSDIDLVVCTQMDLRGLAYLTRKILHQHQLRTAAMVGCLSHAPILITCCGPLLAEPFVVRSSILSHLVLFAGRVRTETILQAMQTAATESEGSPYSHQLLRRNLQDLLEVVVEAPLYNDDDPIKRNWKRQQWSRKYGRALCVSLRAWIYATTGEIVAANDRVLNLSARMLGLDHCNVARIRRSAPDDSETTAFALEVIDRCARALAPVLAWSPSNSLCNPPVANTQEREA